jgi:hypothetical protein
MASTEQVAAGGFRSTLNSRINRLHKEESIWHIGTSHRRRDVFLCDLNSCKICISSLRPALLHIAPDHPFGCCSVGLPNKINKCWRHLDDRNYCVQLGWFLKKHMLHQYETSENNLSGPIDVNFCLQVCTPRVISLRMTCSKFSAP